ncbi:MAG TPA: OmpA family protein, partial [Bacteroidia bacterium]|nr:OmpA family protein [Bacteroidia bacterium]
MKIIRLVLLSGVSFANLHAYAQQDSALSEVTKMRATLIKYQSIPPTPEPEQFVSLKKSTYDSLITMLNNQMQQIDKQHQEMEAIRQRLLNISTGASTDRASSNVIYFETGSAILSREAEADIKNLIHKTGTSGSFMIEGYADVTGAQESNEKLSQDRANAVKYFMITACK